MANDMHALVSEAKKSRFCYIPKLSDADVVSIWDSVSKFIEHQMRNQKGVTINGLGTFTFSQKKLDVGNKKFLLIQRPIFLLSEKFAQTHGLSYSKQHTTGNIPVVQLNFAALSAESPYDRDTVEGCVREVLQALARAIGSGRNVEFAFNGIGRLSVRDAKVKLKFYKDFLKSMDGTGKLADSLKNRPFTADSVISRMEYIPSRCHSTNTMVLPRISTANKFGGQGLSLEKDLKEMEAIVEEDEDFLPRAGGEEEEGLELEERPDSGRKLSARQTVPTAKVTGVSIFDELQQQPPNAPSPTARDQYPAPPQTPSPTARAGLLPPSPPRIPSPSSSQCGHMGAGQELCYMCHQRRERNVPVSFEVERRQKEEEEDRLLQQYQYMKDTEKVVKEQSKNLANRHHSQKVSAFNLGVAEAIKTQKKERSPEFHRSYLFQHRPLTPPKFIKQEKLSEVLDQQVDDKIQVKAKIKQDNVFLEKLEQVQLAEDLAAQREKYLRDKAEQCESYQRALSAQVRFKPIPIPKAVPDSKSPVFGKNDASNEKLLEERRQARELFKSQKDVVQNRKRENILKQLRQQKQDLEVLERTKKEMIDDQSKRFEKANSMRRSLEDEWLRAHAVKANREREERILANRSPGMLLLEQCDRYHRCKQCRRNLQNCGETNIWSESRYIPGTRLMV